MKATNVKKELKYLLNGKHKVSKSLRRKLVLEAKFLANKAYQHPFYSSPEWRKLRLEVLRGGSVCKYCGSNNNLQVDHILPRSKYPHLALQKNNLQVLCKSCNFKKGCN